MAIDDGARIPSDRREIEGGDRRVPPVTDRRRSRTGTALGSLLALLILAGAIYYFAGNRAGPDAPVPSAKQSAENVPAPTPRSAENPNQPVASATPPQPQSPSPAPTPSQPPPAASPPTLAPTAETPKPQSAPPAQTATNNAPAAPPPAAQPPMRDQPAALPDQPAGAPKNEVILVVKRGPANIRSEPGKNGRVVGTVAKNAQLKELSRSGSWVEVETDSGRGWISSGLLAPP